MHSILCNNDFKPTGKRLLGRPRSRWEDNVRIDLNEIGIGTRNWVDSAQDRALVNMAFMGSISHGVSYVIMVY